MSTIINSISILLLCISVIIIDNRLDKIEDNQQIILEVLCKDCVNNKD